MKIKKKRTRMAQFKKFCCSSRVSSPEKENVFRLKTKVKWGAAIAQWIRLPLPSCRPGFDSQVCHLCFLFIAKIFAIFVHAM